MASFDTPHTAAGHPASKASNVFMRTFGALAQWNDARVTRNALYKLSERELDDIGLTLGDIENVATRAYR